MQRVKTLIDKAVEMCGTQEALAMKIGMHPSQLSGLRTGNRHISPDVAILIADIGKQNVEDAALAAIIENGLNTERGEKVQAILGKSMLARMMK